MSMPPKAAATASKAARTEAALVTSQTTGNADGPMALACSLAAAKLTSSNATSAPAAAKAFAVAAPMRAGAGDGGDLAGERRFLAGAELGLFERPIFAIEHVGFGDRLEAADRLGVADAFDPGLGDIGGDLASRLVRPRPNSRAPAPARRGQGIEFMFDMADAGIVLLEIAVICAANWPAVSCATRANSPSFPGRVRQHQRPVLGADGVVRRHHAGLAVRAKSLALMKLSTASVARIRARAAQRLRLFCLFRCSAAHDRRDQRHVALPRRAGAVADLRRRPTNSSARDTISIMRS